MIAQNKGKQYNKLPKTKIPRPSEQFYCSTKLDGAYIQVHIHKATNDVFYFTSGGHEFELVNLKPQFIQASDFVNADIVIFECEYTHDSEGRHGDRTSTGMITTYRTNFNHRIESKATDKDMFRIFDVIDMPPRNRTFRERLHEFSGVRLGENMTILAQELVVYGDAVTIAEDYVSRGWEGIMLKSPNHKYKPGKRTNDIIKVKFPKVGVATVIREIEGSGRLVDMIGALEVEFEHKGNKVRFNIGTGFSDKERSLWGCYKDKHIQFEYESIQIQTPVQPSYKGILPEYNI